jgi:hypothetical protein
VHVLLLVTFSFREKVVVLWLCAQSVAAVCECTIAGALVNGMLMGSTFLLLCSFFSMFDIIMGTDNLSIPCAVAQVANCSVSLRLIVGLQTCISYVMEGFGNVPAWESLLC